MQAKKRERLAEEKAARHRARDATDAYHPDQTNSRREGEQDSTVGHETTAVRGDESLTGEFIATYERSEGVRLQPCQTRRRHWCIQHEWRWPVTSNQRRWKVEL